MEVRRGLSDPARSQRHHLCTLASRARGHVSLVVSHRIRGAQSSSLRKLTQDTAEPQTTFRPAGPSVGRAVKVRKAQGPRGPRR